MCLGKNFEGLINNETKQNLVTITGQRMVGSTDDQFHYTKNYQEEEERLGYVWTILGRQRLRMYYI